MKWLGWMVLLTWFAWPPATGACAALAMDVVGPSFGRFETHAATARPAVGTIRLRCVQGGRTALPFTISLVDATGPAQARRPAQEGVIRYRLFVDAAATRPWGDGRADTETVSGVFAPSQAGAERVILIYAVIDPGQRPAVGHYRDSAVARLEYGRP